MNIPGQRFELNLDSDGDLLDRLDFEAPQTPFVKDIVEKTSSQPPIAPSLPTDAPPTGFPPHRRRGNVQRPIRGGRGGGGIGSTAPPVPPLRAAPGLSPPLSQQPPPRLNEITAEEKRQISEDNDRRLAAMSPEEIEQERKELMENLSPALLSRFLKRANLQDPNVSASGWNAEGSRFSRPQRNPPGLNTAQEPAEQPKTKPAPKSAPEDSLQQNPDYSKLGPDERAPPVPVEPAPVKIPIHFPRPPTPPDLDPSSPEFLEQLHNKYFPNLPVDPTKLSWMAPISDAEAAASPYRPSQPDIPASALRFDFKGNLLPPRKAAELPTHLGLHHHGDAPDAAGYTVPELAHLARSSFPAQRCMAMQTLGRILYKLGVGAYNSEEITQGLWKCMGEGRVLEGLEETASGKYSGHVGMQAYATEALWLWQKGGGHKWKAS